MNRWRRAAVSGPMANYIRRTQTELDELVGSWRDDPCFDLEDAPGFEAHREELQRIRLKVETEQASRAAREHEAAITGLMRVALASLPESDERGGLIRSEAERPEHAANRLLRAVAAMLLPVVERLDRIDVANDGEHLRLQDDINSVRKAVRAL